MSSGRVDEVLKNSWHEAGTVRSTASIAEAYQLGIESPGAACDCWDHLPSQMLSWTHSIMEELKYVSPFQASLIALNLQWEVGVDLLHSHSTSNPISLAVDPICHPSIPSQRAHSRLAVSKQVRFADQIDVFLGDDDEVNMSCVQVTQAAISNWRDKPWSRRRIRPKHSCLSISVAPLSEVAVSSRDLDSSFDALLLMQTVQMKHDIHTVQETNLLDALGEGQTNTERLIHGDHDPDGLDASSLDDPSPSASSGIQPPSSTNDLQEVIMFHLRDPPLRAFLDWSSYNQMIRDIAGHYSTIVENVVDAYEINADIPGIPPDAVPVIVHLFPDIAVAHTAKLALFDVEYHAHNTEPNFRLGPRTQRFVLPVPEWIDRASILVLGDVEIYCQKERDRCFVWHGNQRWQDTDLQVRQIAHGDYFKIAVPPTERFLCGTQQVVDWTQRGMSDEDIMQITTAPEVDGGYSPSLLGDDEVRVLATPHLVIAEVEDDHFHAMQRSLSSDTGQDTLFTPRSESSSGNRDLQEWNIDLQRLVDRHISQCPLEQNAEEEFLFSVYTWYIDHSSHQACFTPKIAILGGDPTEWEEDLRHPWRFHIRPDLPLFIDMVSPFTPRADVEEHIAHVLFSQGTSRLSTVLVSLEFIAPTTPHVIVRCAVALPNPCTRQDIGDVFPLFARFPDDRIRWLHPVVHPSQEQIGIRNGLGISMQVLPEQIPTHDVPLQDVTNLVQIDLNKPVVKHRSESKAIEVSAHDSAPQCSFTDEFLEAISAAEEAARMEPQDMPAHDEAVLFNLPEAFRVLLDSFAEEEISSPAHLPRTRRVESWFLDHVSFDRCHASRISLLSDDVRTWKLTLTETWRDKIIDNADINFHLVNPETEDAAAGIIGQLVLSQRAAHDLRSAVLSVYDSDPDMERSPHTFALVLPRQANLERLLVTLHLTLDCPPENRRNHCSWWFGRIPIDEAHVVNVHMGHAFRLVISRGVPIDLTSLLNMDDVTLRDTLQRAISPEILIRPVEPAFLHPDNDALPSHLPVVIPDGRPGWIAVLQQHFDRFHERDSLDSGPFLRVSSWYLNVHPNYHCSLPQFARISDDPLMWRTEIMFPWREQFLRATPADFYVLPGLLSGSPNAPQEVHILFHQGLTEDLFAVLITLRGVAPLQLRTRRFAHVFRARESVRAILRLAVPAEHAHRPALVQYEGCTYLSGEHILLHTGSHLVVEISPHQIDLYTDEIADDVSMFQQIVTCKPAPFEEPDDLAMSLPNPTLPPRSRPVHDGEFEWSLQFGTLMHQFGDVDPWSEAVSMDVITWYVDHVRRPTCRQPRVVRMYGHAATWIEDLRHAWADALDRHSAFSIFSGTATTAPD